MHEISLLESVLETLESQAQQQDFKQVKQITLEIGALSCVAVDALRFGFDVVMKNSLAENAELVIIEIAGKGQCSKCGQIVELETLHDPCSHCGAFGVTVTQGEQMRIKELKVI